MLHFVENFYFHVRNTLVWFVVYFFIQAMIWIALGLLIIIYPQALFIIAAAFFVVLAGLNMYFVFLFIRYAMKLKKMYRLLQLKA